MPGGIDAEGNMGKKCYAGRYECNPFVPFENTPENAREILANLGQNIDVVAGIRN